MPQCQSNEITPPLDLTECRERDQTCGVLDPIVASVYHQGMLSNDNGMTVTVTEHIEWLEHIG